MTKIDQRIREYLLAKSLIWQSHSDGIEYSGYLFEDHGMQTQVNCSSVCRIQTQNQPVGLLLDFGRELHGGLRIVTGNTRNSKPARLRIRFGESVSEAMSEDHDGSNTGNDHGIRDEIIQVPWLGSREIGETGFRFVRIDLMDLYSFVEFKAVRAVFIYRDIEYKGNFRSNDEKLNRIWQTGAYTVHLNMQNYLWDGIKRDRLVWMGDIHPQIRTISAVFGQNPIVAQSLDFMRDTTPLPQWMNGICSYSLWWIIAQRDWFYYSGDNNYLREQTGYLHQLLDILIEMIDENGSEKLTKSRFLDWPSSNDEHTIHVGLHSLMVMVFQAGLEIGCALKNESIKKLCNSVLIRLKEYIPRSPENKKAVALMVLSGLINPEAADAEIISQNAPHGFSTYFGYYLLKAMAMAGKFEESLECIRKYWGGMLDMGATTFWEDFDLSWTKNAYKITDMPVLGKKSIHGDFGGYCYVGHRHSLCHGWASGPTAWLSEHVLGIKTLSPGMNSIAIEPNLADLDWVEGTYPTPSGIITVKHERKGLEIISNIEVPSNIKVVQGSQKIRFNRIDTSVFKSPKRTYLTAQ